MTIPLYLCLQLRMLELYFLIHFMTNYLIKHALEYYRYVQRQHGFLPAREWRRITKSKPVELEAFSNSDGARKPIRKKQKSYLYPTSTHLLQSIPVATLHHCGIPRRRKGAVIANLAEYIPLPLPLAEHTCERRRYSEGQIRGRLRLSACRRPLNPEIWSTRPSMAMKGAP